MLVNRTFIAFSNKEGEPSFEDSNGAPPIARANRPKPAAAPPPSKRDNKQEG